MKLIDQINGSALFAQSALSASIATKDSLGRDITATYLTGIDLSNYYTKDETSGAEQLAQAFAAIPSDVATTGDLDNLEQTISSTYYPKSNPSSFATESWVTSQGYLTAHQDISNKLDSSAFSTVSGDFLTTSFSIPESAVWNDTSNVVQTHSAQWAEGGSGGSVSSKYGTISVDGSNIEATNKAIEFKSNGFTSSFDSTYVSNENPPAIFTWGDYSQETSIHVEAYNDASEDTKLTYSSNTNVTGEIITGAYNSYFFNVQIPNATAIQFSSDNGTTLQTTRVSAPSSYGVSELAWKNDLPTYTYNSANKLSAINGSALVGNEDYIVEQGFVQNLTSPKGTISVLNNNKIECTNSAIASDVIEGFVSAYNDKNTFPGYSATLTWDRYVPNTKLLVSGAEYAEHTLTYSADTDVTGTITVQADGQASIELPNNSTSIVIGNENLDVPTYNFTVSAADNYEIGELAWASALPTFEYDSTNKISAINGSAIAGGSDVPVSADEAIQYVQTNSAVIDATITNVTLNSGVWGGSALPISAGPGIKVNLVDNTLVFSNDETVLWSGNALTGTLNESPWNFKKLGFETSGSLNSLQYNEFPAISGKNMMAMTTIGPESTETWHFTPSQISFNGNTFTLKSCDFYAKTNQTTFNSNAGYHIKMIKVIGINRIAGGN